MVAPALPKFSLPPVWSPCTCVLTRNLIFWSDTLRMAAMILSLSGANCESTMKMPSGP